jgi:hypothetical protein
LGGSTPKPRSSSVASWAEIWVGSGAGKFLCVGARRWIVDHIGAADLAEVSGSVAAGPRKAAAP